MIAARSLGSVLVLVAVFGCNSAVCGRGYGEFLGRCIDQELIPLKTCSPPCNADAHETCIATTDSAYCDCAPGYDGAPCEWVGVIEDPGFANADAWTTSNGWSQPVTIDEGRSKHSDDPGVATFLPSMLCNGGVVSQEINMPEYAAAGPLVLEVTYLAEGNVKGVSVGFDDAWSRLPIAPPVDGGKWPTKSFCLGEAAYGGEVPLKIGSTERSDGCDNSQEEVGQIEVDRVDIRPASKEDNCPAPGEAFNWDAKSDSGGWEFTEAGEATAGYYDDSRSGRDVVRLYSPGDDVLDDEASMKTTISVPLPDDESAVVPEQQKIVSPALTFWWRGTSGAYFQLRIGSPVREVARLNSRFGTLKGAGLAANEPATYCLPPWTHGSVIGFSFSIEQFGPPRETELVVDGLRIVDAPECGTSTNVHDPSFDSPHPRPGVSQIPRWDMNSESFLFDGSALMVADEEAAHSPDGFLEISYDTTAAWFRLETWVLVPPPEGNDGPQIRFWSKRPTNPAIPAQWISARTSDAKGELDALNRWKEKRVCIEPEWADRWHRFQIDVGPGPPTQNIPDESVLIDDFALTTDQGCRAE